MNWKLALLGVVVFVTLIVVVMYYKKISTALVQGFQNISGKNEFIMYYAEWCPHCKTVMPDFDNFSKDGSITVNGKSVNVKKYEASKDADKIQGKNIKGFPTFMLSTAEGNDIEYKGPRTSDDYLKFLNKELGGGI